MQRAPFSGTRRRQRTPVPDPGPAESGHGLGQTVPLSRAGSAADPNGVGGPRQQLFVARRIAVGPKLDVATHTVFGEPGIQTCDFVGPSGPLAADDLAGEDARFVGLQLA